MSNEVSGMPQLTQFIVPAPEGIDTATMLIASTDPIRLGHAAHAILVSDEILHDYAEQTFSREQTTYDRIMRTSRDEQTRTRAKEDLLKAAQTRYRFQSERKSIADDVGLAHYVRRKQLELSRPLRFIASASLALVMGGAATAIAFEAERLDAASAAGRVKDYNRTVDSNSELPLPDGKVPGENYALVVLLGSVAAAWGGKAGYKIGKANSAKFAHERAKRQVRRAS